ncbi:unnamed protein product [Angiostrongylus costaricensis]|uniref:Anillin domain-containing protein n=1 Tax=Angiostrongylus costaricensis TaxID=334426 RepID=A0A158PLZ9_ANGCS|nr:unnamed protein product [Angiostrongylus costaricensis]
MDHWQKTHIPWNSPFAAQQHTQRSQLSKGFAGIQSVSRDFQRVIELMNSRKGAIRNFIPSQVRACPSPGVWDDPGRILTNIEATLEIGRLKVDGSTGVRECAQQSGNASRASISGKIFERKEKIVVRRDGYKEEVIPYISTVQLLKRNQFGEEDIAAVATLEKLSQKAVHPINGKYPASTQKGTTENLMFVLMLLAQAVVAPLYGSRHIPRGHTRDLVKLFDRMVKDAGRGTTSLRAKSLPPSKQRTQFTRSRSVQRRADSSIQIGVSKSESKTQFGFRELLTKKLSLPTQGVVNENQMNSSRPLVVSSERNNYSDAHALSFHGLNLAKQQLTGVLACFCSEIGIDGIVEDEVVSNDSTDERRMSTPVGSRDESMSLNQYFALISSHKVGDLSNAFGHLPSIDSLNISAILHSKCVGSEFNGSTHFSEHNSLIDIHKENREKRTLNEPGSDCEQPAALKESHPPQRLPLSHRNSIQSGCSFQHRQSADGEQCRSSESHSTRHYNEIEQVKVDAEIDRLFEFTEEQEHDDLGTIGCETLPEREISVLKHGDADTARDDGMSPNRAIQHISRVSVDPPVPLSPLSAPAAGIGVGTYKSRKEINGKKKLKDGIYVQEKQIRMTMEVLALARKSQDSMQEEGSFMKAFPCIVLKKFSLISEDEVDAHRTLLLARERLDLLRCEMNLVSALSAFRIPPRLVSQELRGTMTISNITCHLSRYFCWREPNDDSSYAFLILLKCGTEVQATAPISLFAHNQLRVRQLTFAEHIQFVNLPVDFNVVVEVCAMELPISKKSEQSCATNIAKKCLNLLNSDRVSNDKCVMEALLGSIASWCDIPLAISER